jgi:NAD(P)-dependent dehydrogenase (short-subunit alcohol dehydrogenase family)
MNKSILITGANAGLGKETARQLAMKNGTERIILGCRNPRKAELAKKELEEATDKQIFEILLMDVSSAASVKKAVSELEGGIDALVMNAGGMGGRFPNEATESGMNIISATNLLGHVVLAEELLKQEKINNVILFASSEAARGIKKLGSKRPALDSNSKQELASILDGNYFGKKFDDSLAYAHVKYVGTLWMSSLARKYPNVKMISISPGATSGTAAADNVAPLTRFMFKYVMTPIVLPLMGMVHKVDKGAARFVDALSNENLRSGGFYASTEPKLTGELVDQFDIFPTMANNTYQDNAYEAVHQFVAAN